MSAGNGAARPLLAENALGFFDRGDGLGVTGLDLCLAPLMLVVAVARQYT